MMSIFFCGSQKAAPAEEPVMHLERVDGRQCQELISVRR